MLKKNNELQRLKIAIDMNMPNKSVKQRSKVFMKEYKFSYYNEIFTVDKKVYIYNSITGGLGELDEQAVKLYKKCNDKGMF